MRIVSAHALSKEGLPPATASCLARCERLDSFEFLSIGRGSLSIGVGGLRIRGCCQPILNLSLLVLVLGQGCSFEQPTPTARWLVKL
jgi:hypothetical protein